MQFKKLKEKNPLKHKILINMYCALKLRNYKMYNR